MMRIIKHQWKNPCFVGPIGSSTPAHHQNHESVCWVKPIPEQPRLAGPIHTCFRADIPVPTASRPPTSPLKLLLAILLTFYVWMK